MSLFFLFFQLFSSALLLLFNGICWVGRRAYRAGAGSRCGGEDDVYVNDRWPRLFELFESAKKILLSTQRRPVQTNGQTDRWSVCIVRVGVCAVCVCVCVWENNSASLASFIISFLNSRCCCGCRAAASAAWHYFLFPMLSAFIKKFITPCTVITTTKTTTTISRRAKALREYFRPNKP